VAPTILRLPAVIEQSGLARSTVYKAITEGLWTRPIKISFRSVGWPSPEVAAIIGARIAGKTDNEIRALVIALETSRKDADSVGRPR
jgi:prophage regulatory protein